MRSSTILLLLVCAAAFAAHRAGLQNEFLIYDDDVVIVENPHLDAIDADALSGLSTEVLNHAYLPLYGLSYVPEAALAGKDPRAFHLASILWHLLCVLGVYYAASRLRLPEGGAVIAALVFALHPVLVESVAWASGRKDQVSLLLMLLSFGLALDGIVKGGVTRPLLAAFLALLAMFAKATVVVLPALLLLGAVYRLGREDVRGIREAGMRRTWTTAFLLALPVIGATVVHLSVASGQSTAGSAAYHEAAQGFGLFAEAFARYLRQLVAPFWLSIHHDLGPLDGPGIDTLLGTLGLVGGVAATWWALRGRGGLVALGGAWLLVSLLPFNNVFPRTSVVMADRYLVIGMVGFGLMVAGVLLRLPARPRLAAVAVLALGWGLLTDARTREFRDTETVFAAAMSQDEKDPLAPMMRADAILRRPGTRTEAERKQVLAWLRESVENSWHPLQEARVRQRLAETLLRQRSYQAALEAHDRLIELLASDPGRWPELGLDLATIRHNRGRALQGLGRVLDAREVFEAVLKDEPQHSYSRLALAQLDLQRGQGLIAATEDPEVIERGQELVMRAVADLELLLEDESVVKGARGRELERTLLVAITRAQLGARNWLPGALISALGHVETLLDRAPDAPEGYELRARVRQAAAMPGVEDDLRAALERSPGDGRLRFELARSLRGRGSKQEALRILKAIEEGSEWAEPARAEMADLYLSEAHSLRAQGETQRALVAAAEAARLAPELSEALLTHAEFLEQIGSWKEAKELYARVHAKEPDSSRARRGLARWHQAAGLRLQTDRRRLVEEAEEAERDELDRKILDRIVAEFRTAIELAGQAEDAALARRFLREQDRQQREVAARHRKEAVAALRKDDRARATELLERAIEIDATDAESWILLGVLRQQAKERDGALEALQKGLSYDPDHLMGLFHCTQMLYVKGRDAEAKTTGERFLKLVDGRPELADRAAQIRRLIRPR